MTVKTLYILLLGMLLTGCAASSPTVAVTTGPSIPMPLAVWRIQAFSDNVSSPGGNTGCRLSDTEIAAVVINLVSNSRVLGPRAIPTWNGVINPIFSPWIGSRPLLYDSVQAAVADFYFDTGDGWDPNAINIYFVGDHQAVVSPYPTTKTLQFTYDPQLAVQAGAFPLIAINDHGFNSSFGFATGFSLSWILSSNASPHELCHYMGRFQSSCYPRGVTPTNPNRCYSTSEHVPLAAWNLMRASVPLPLSFAGSPLLPNTEKGEIDQRIFRGPYSAGGGGWNEP